MKTFLTSLFCALLLTSCSSSHSETKEACVKIYQEGTEQIEKAKSPREISDISYNVALQISDLGNGPEGDKKLSATDQMAIYEAQTKFYQAIEKRSRQLIPSAQPPATTAPIIRTENNQ